MKRFLQIVAVFVMVLFAGQPALAGLSCSLGVAATGGCVSGCMMAAMSNPMESMNAGCPMSPQLIAGGCGQSCCQAAQPQSVAQPSSGIKLQAGHAALLAVMLHTPLQALSAEVAPARVVSMVPSRDRSILFQVFRI